MPSVHRRGPLDHAVIRFLPFVFVVFLLLVPAWGVAAPANEAPADSLSSVLDDLRGVEAEMAANQQNIEALKQRIAELQTLGRNADDEIAKLQALVEAHAGRVEQLTERYARALELAQRLQHELELSNGWNLALGGGAAVAVLVAVIEGWALLAR